MKRLTFALIGYLLPCLGMLAQSAGGAFPAHNPDEQMLLEQKNFVECLSSVYSPGWWLSYNDGLYFQPRNEAQVQQLEALKAARSRYVALTNHATRHALTTRLIRESGIGEPWQRKILLPLSTSNQTLTPTLDRPVRVVPKYTLLQSLPSGDALMQADAATYFVMNFGRGADDAYRTNALLIREGVKSYSAGGEFKMYEAFANVALSKEETAVLTRVVAAFQKEAAALGQEISNLKYGRDFEEYKARASDSSPYMEYLLAKAYLEGKGTEKNEQLGLDWMNRAARGGSGDAKSYLEALGRKAP
jgi:TPR repeat protein